MVEILSMDLMAFQHLDKHRMPINLRSLLLMLSIIMCILTILVNQNTLVVKTPLLILEWFRTVNLSGSNNMEII